MSGFDDIRTRIAAAYPSGTTFADQIDDLLRELELSIDEGVSVEHSNGSDDPDFQGMHTFPSGGSLPTATLRPEGHLFFRGGVADQWVPYLNGGSSWTQAGIALLSKGASSIAVNAGTSQDVFLSAYAAAHREYLVSAYVTLPSINNPLIVYGTDDGSTTAIFVYVVRDPAGNDVLRITNTTVNNEVVAYRTRIIVG